MCHVLIIEDEILIALDLQDILTLAGAKTFSFAETEREALDAAREHRPDVIMSDVMLREGTGPHAVEVIQGEMGPLPVIFITATPEACLSCDPPAIVLGKPVIDARLREAFRLVAPH
ncbi:MAG: response regulator [Pseudomonadota bacterium]